MICSHTKPLHLQNSTIFGILLCVATVVAAVCNILVLMIIVRLKKRSATNYILLSLAIADVLVGTILGPITVMQVLDVELSVNCTANFVRGYFLVLLVGSSLLTLAVVSYDRYLLLTKRSNYNQHMTMHKAAFLIGFSWLFPGLIPITKSVYMVYSILCMANYTLPLIALATFYFLITKEVRKRENELCHKIKSESTRQKYLTAEPNVHCKVSASRKHVTHLRIAKSVMLLIACYFACIFPLNIWMFLELTKVEYSKVSSEIFYLSSLFLMQVNSCINPVIYFSKQKEFKKGFKHLFKRRTSSTTPLE